MPSVFSGSDDFQDTFSAAPEIDADDESNAQEAELLMTNRLHQVCPLALCSRKCIMHNSVKGRSISDMVDMDDPISSFTAFFHFQIETSLSARSIRNHTEP